MKLNFYKQPFRVCKYSSWVYDAASNFVFQFEPIFDKNGDYAKGEIERQNAIIESLNSDELKPIKGLSLTSERSVIYNNNIPLITIRGWGNLTGVGAHNLSSDVAAKIQDDFGKWIIYKLTTTK